MGSAFCCPRCRAPNRERARTSRERAVGVDVARGREADATGDGAGQVGQDVAEEVVGDDDVEAGRVCDQEDRGRVDVQVVDRHVRVLGAPPRRRSAARATPAKDSTLVLCTSVSFARALGAARRRSARRARRRRRCSPRPRWRSRAACPADRRRRCRRTGPSVPSRTTTKSTSPGSGSGAGDAGVQLGGAQVDVVVEREAQLQQQPALDVRVLQARVAGHAADRAEQDRVVRRRSRRGRRRSACRRSRGSARRRARTSVFSNATASPATAASSTFSASAMTSGPMPSPGITARRMVRVTGGSSPEPDAPGYSRDLRPGPSRRRSRSPGQMPPWCAARCPATCPAARARRAPRAHRAPLERGDRARFVLSVRTVESHVASLLRKTGAADRRELAELGATLIGGGARHGPRPPARAALQLHRTRRRAGGARGRAAGEPARHRPRTGRGGQDAPRPGGRARRARVPDGAVYVDLVPVTDPARVASAVAAAAGVGAQQAATPEEALEAWLHGRRVLLVLDNCEHLLDGVAPLLERLLASSDGLTVLATSRTRLLAALRARGADPRALGRRGGRVGRRGRAVPPAGGGAGSDAPAADDRPDRGDLPPAGRHGARHRARRGAGAVDRAGRARARSRGRARPARRRRE